MKAYGQKQSAFIESCKHQAVVKYTGVSQVALFTIDCYQKQKLGMKSFYSGKKAKSGEYRNCNRFSNSRKRLRKHIKTTARQSVRQEILNNFKVPNGYVENFKVFGKGEERYYPEYYINMFGRVEPLYPDQYDDSFYDYDEPYSYYSPKEMDIEDAYWEKNYNELKLYKYAYLCAPQSEKDWEDIWKEFTDDSILNTLYSQDISFVEAQTRACKEIELWEGEEQTINNLDMESLFQNYFEECKARWKNSLEQKDYVKLSVNRPKPKNNKGKK